MFSGNQQLIFICLVTNLLLIGNSNQKNYYSEFDPLLSDDLKPTEKCLKSLTETGRGRTHCKGDLIFSDDFDTFNKSVWSTESRFPSEFGDYEFVTYLGEPLTRNGSIIFKALFVTDETFRPFYKGNVYDLGAQCSNLHEYFDVCVLKLFRGNFVSPIVVPRINTKESFSFKYGRIVVSAMLPMGDWTVPIIALEPTHNVYGAKPYQSGQIRIAFTRGNVSPMSFKGVRIDNQSLFGGVVVSTNASDRHRYMVNDQQWLALGFENHVYEMVWLKTSISFYYDGKFYGEIRGPFTTNDPISHVWKARGGLAPFDQLFHLTLGLSVGGFGDFPQDAEGFRFWEPYDVLAKKKFFNEAQKMFGSWTDRSMKINYIKVYAV